MLENTLSFIYTARGIVARFIAYFVYDRCGKFTPLYTQIYKRTYKCVRMHIDAIATIRLAVEETSNETEAGLCRGRAIIKKNVSP